MFEVIHKNKNVPLYARDNYQSICAIMIFHKKKHLNILKYDKINYKKINQKTLIFYGIFSMSIPKFILKYHTKHSFIFTMMTNQQYILDKIQLFASTPNIASIS